MPDDVDPLRLIRRHVFIIQDPDDPATMVVEPHELILKVGIGYQVRWWNLNPFDIELDFDDLRPPIRIPDQKQRIQIILGRTRERVAYHVTTIFVLPQPFRTRSDPTVVAAGDPEIVIE
jgi:hypothetical protein